MIDPNDVHKIAENTTAISRSLHWLNIWVFLIGLRLLDTFTIKLFDKGEQK